MTSRGVVWWRTSLRAIAVLNVVLWALSAAAVMRAYAPATQLLLSAAYVAGCAYRSLLPVIDIPRLVLVDSRLSRVSIGRSVATVAELCFAAQWALMLHRLASLSGSALGQALSAAVIPLIVLAEGCSWYAVLTTEQRAHALENSLWGLSAVALIGAMLAIGPARTEHLYPLVLAGGAIYVAFIFVYDVPMYWSRWRADRARGRRYLSVADGWLDVRRRWTVSWRWEDWQDEVPWMSLYFTFGVWSSIWLVYATLRVS